MTPVLGEGRAPPAARRRGGRVILALVMAAVCGGCDRGHFAQAERSIADGEAKQSVQHMLDHTRQCAGLLRDVGLTKGHLEMSPGDEARPGVRALVAAGLIEADAAQSRSAPGGVLYVPTAMARPYVEEQAFGDGAGRGYAIKLCYARPQVVQVWLKPHGRADLSPSLGYTYRLVDAPVWARRPDISAAFPWLPKVLAGKYLALGFFRYQDGRWTSDLAFPEVPSDEKWFWFKSATSAGPRRARSHYHSIYYRRRRGVSGHDAYEAGSKTYLT